MIIPDEYYSKEIKIKLTHQEIEQIIETLERTEHNLFVFLGYDKIIKKLKREK